MWEDRLQEASYITPSGIELSFDYEDVSLSLDKKGTVFNFPDVNGSYVQQTGNTSRQCPLRCFFWGADYDIESENFIK